MGITTVWPGLDRRETPAETLPNYVLILTCKAAPDYAEKVGGNLQKSQ